MKYIKFISLIKIKINYYTTRVLGNFAHSLFLHLLRLVGVMYTIGANELPHHHHHNDNNNNHHYHPSKQASKQENLGSNKTTWYKFQREHLYDLKHAYNCVICE